jgi:hypothetical protein
VCSNVPVLYKVGPGQYPYILFDQQRAYVVDPKDVSGDDVLKRRGCGQMWILVDAIASPHGIPPELLSDGGPASMLVYSSSPQLSRWKSANQSNIYLATIIMNPWSKWEAELL